MSTPSRIVFVFLIIPSLVGAQNLVKNGDAESKADNWSSSVEACADSPYAGKFCFKMLAGNATSAELIAVDPQADYELSGWFRSADDRATNLYLGLMPFDADRNQIHCQQVGAIASTETELTQACETEDTEILIKNGANWKPHDGYCIAFEVDGSGECNDLPNRKLSSTGVASVEKNGDAWTVTLLHPCGKSYPSGAKVREHGGYLSSIFPVYRPKFLSGDWRELAGDIKGTSKSGDDGNHFWRGTRYVRVIVLALGGGRVFFDDVTFQKK